MRILPRGSAIVRGEKNVGVVSELQFVEHVEDATDRLIKVVDHGGVPVDGVDLARRAGFVPCQRGRLDLCREVDGIVRYLQIKRCVGAGLMTYELNCTALSVREPVRPSVSII